MSARRILAIGGGALAIVSIAACSTILGFDDVTLDTSVGDASVDAPNRETGTTDGAIVDSSADATADGSGDSGEASACGDTMSTDANCGRCGHSCLGGGCVMGVCQPITLSKGYDGAYGIALDATTVYFTARVQNEIYRVGKDGKNAMRIAGGSDALAPGAIAADGTSFYWANVEAMGEIRKCPLAGCPAGGSTLVANAASPTSVRVTSQYVYFAENNAGAITRTALDGSGRVSIFADDAGAAPRDLVLDDLFAYATDDTDGTVRRIALDGGALTVLASGAGVPTYTIALGDGGLFFGSNPVNSADGILWQIASPRGDAGAATAVAMGFDYVTGIACDDAFVYFGHGTTNAATGQILACPVSGCGAGPTVLAANLQAPIKIAVDADSIYWTEFGVDSSPNGGSVKRLAKP